MTLQILIAIVLALCWAHSGYQLLRLARLRFAHLGEIDRHQVDVACQVLYLGGFMVCLAMALYAVTGYPQITWREFLLGPSPQQEQPARSEHAAQQLHQAAAQRRAIQKTHDLVLHAGSEPLLPWMINPLPKPDQKPAHRRQHNGPAQARVTGNGEAAHDDRDTSNREGPVPVLRNPTRQLFHPTPPRNSGQTLAPFPLFTALQHSARPHQTTGATP